MAAPAKNPAVPASAAPIPSPVNIEIKNETNGPPSLPNALFIPFCNNFPKTPFIPF